MIWIVEGLGEIMGYKVPTLVSSSLFVANPIPKHKHLFFYLLCVLPDPQYESLFTEEQHATERSSSDQPTPQKGKQASMPKPPLPPPRAFSGDLEGCSAPPCRITDRCEARLTSKAPPLPTLTFQMLPLMGPALSEPAPKNLLGK